MSNLCLNGGSTCIQNLNLGQDTTPGDLRQVPTANFVVRYAAQQTGGQLNGLVACELSPRTHGVDQWWVLLE